MNVILNDYVEQLGERGDSVSVKPGFARNYLYPQGLAYPDTPGNRRRFDQEQKRWEGVELKRRSAAETAGAQLRGTELIFERRAGETGALFGSVTINDVIRALDAKGFEIDRKKVVMADTFKALGSFATKIKVHRDVVIDIPVYVVRPGGSVADIKNLGTKAEDAEDAATNDESAEAVAE